MKTVIQINSIDALNKLIEKDEKLELEIRNNVANALVKNSLSRVINIDAVKTQAEIIKTEIHKELFTKAPSYYWSDYILSEKAENHIRSHVDYCVGMILNKKVRELVDEYIEKNNIDEIITSKIEYFTEKYISERIKKEIKEKLGL